MTIARQQHIPGRSTEAQRSRHLFPTCTTVGKRLESRRQSGRGKPIEEVLLRVLEGWIARAAFGRVGGHPSTRAPLSHGVQFGRYVS